MQYSEDMKMVGSSDKKEKEETNFVDMDYIDYIKNFMKMAEFGSEEELEEILRNYNQKYNFLGPNENLYTVKKNDYDTITAKGVSYEQIASTLEKILTSVLAYEGKHYPSQKKHVLAKLGNFVRNAVSSENRNGKPFFLDTNYNLLKETKVSEKETKVPEGAKYKIYLPQREKIYDISCPWSSLTGELAALKCNYADKRNLEVLIENFDTGKLIRFYEIHIHLIREHKFFEGKYRRAEGFKNQYRLNPEDAIDVLEIQPEIKPEVKPEVKPQQNP